MMGALFSPTLPQLAEQVRATLQRARRVHIPNVLAETRAASLHAAMQLTAWRTALNGDGANVYDLKASDVAAMNPAQQEKLLQTVHAKASGGFQFLFDSHRISDQYDSGAVTAGELAEF
jgi:hypothetical protein